MPRHGHRPPRRSSPSPRRCLRRRPIAEPRHGLSAFGELKYPADFKHFDYVNPDAPKGGRARRTIGTGGAHDLRQLQQLHPQGRRGAGPRVSVRQPDGARARRARRRLRPRRRKRPTWRPTACRSTFKLRPEAKFADGTPVTADDVVFSLRDAEGEGPSAAIALHAARCGEGRGARCRTPCATRSRATWCATCRWSSPTLPILSKAYYATQRLRSDDARAAARLGPLRDRRLQAGHLRHLQAPRRLLGQGSAGQSRPLQLRRDALRVLSRPHRSSSRACKAGAYRLARGVHLAATGRRATTSRRCKEGRLVRAHAARRAPVRRAGLLHQHAARAKFADPRVREALDLAFDFEWTNKNLFFGLYTRTAELLRELRHEGRRASRAPEELALLEPFRDKLPPEVFGEPYSPPVTDGSGSDRKLLREAARAARRGRLERSRTASASTPRARRSRSSS